MEEERRKGEVPLLKSKRVWGKVTVWTVRQSLL